ncbi:hypothetical protein VFPBJ_08633 [Purpureocillium lilacinum]|uniref:Uncharacterized protein n=1 Tax=Purpureocillium lilacinum TaxID=33203 RepID=A0A179GFX6_PURLI|nr:hypothetical protein VFPBJ_08633 [Purpureocillium lilacinum]
MLFVPSGSSTVRLTKRTRTIKPSSRKSNRIRLHKPSLLLLFCSPGGRRNSTSTPRILHGHYWV